MTHKSREFLDLVKRIEALGPKQKVKLLDHTLTPEIDQRLAMDRMARRNPAGCASMSSQEASHLVRRIQTLPAAARVKLLSSIMELEERVVRWSEVERIQGSASKSGLSEEALDREIAQAVRAVRRERSRRVRLGAKWEAEIRRRVKDVDAGRVKTVPAKAVFSRLGRLVGTSERRPRRIRTGPGLGDRMAACGPWQGESTEEILRILHEGRHGPGTFKPG